MEPFFSLLKLYFMNRDCVAFVDKIHLYFLVLFLWVKVLDSFDIPMGQKLSSNDQIIHSMKKMKLSSSASGHSGLEDIVIYRIADKLSPSSPFRKDVNFKSTHMKRALYAPLESDFLESTPENIESITNVDAVGFDCPTLSGMCK